MEIFIQNVLNNIPNQIIRNNNNHPYFGFNLAIGIEKNLYNYLVRIPEKEKSEGTDPVPNSDESGNTLVSNSEGQSILKEIRKNVEKPAIVEILRSIY